jgi:hypothetical protein
MSNAVLGFVHHEEWRAQDGIAKLHRKLAASGRAGVPSPDTLARFVDRLHRETGDPALSRSVRARRKSR